MFVWHSASFACYFVSHEFSLLVAEDKLFVYVNVGERGGELREAGWKYE